MTENLKKIMRFEFFFKHRVVQIKKKSGQQYLLTQFFCLERKIFARPLPLYS